MRKYDAQELLRQQKNNVQEHILTIVLSIILGICSSGMSERIKRFIDLSFLDYALGIILLIFLVVIVVFLDRNHLIKINSEVFTTLICFDMEKDPTPHQFEDYLFSVETESYWNLVIGHNKEHIESFKKEHKTNKNYRNYREFFDYKVISDLVQYIILRNISSGITQNPIHFRLPSKYINRIKELPFDLLSYFLKYNKINSAIKNFKFISSYYEKKQKLTNLLFISEGIPIICLPEQIQNNLFVSNLHERQMDYEKEICKTGKLPLSFEYTPFGLCFPDYISIRFEESDGSKINKIILTRKKVGELTIEFHDRWKSLSQRALVQTQMKPGNLYHQFEEIFFEITIDLDIEKHAYFPLFGGGEKATDEFISWAEELIEKLRKSCDWTYYQERITRDILEDIKNKLAFHDLESKIEYYNNFDDTQKGDIERLLRLLLSPYFEEQKYALEKLKINKKNIQSNQLESVIFRILKLARSSDKSTVADLATKTLTDFLDEIPCWLHKRVVEELLDIADNSYDSITARSSLKNLGILFNKVNDTDLKERIQNKVIQACLSESQDFSLFDYSEIINGIYPNIKAKDRREFEEKFLQILITQNKEFLDHAFMFFILVMRFVSNEKIKQVFDCSSKIDIGQLGQRTIGRYLLFLKRLIDTVSSKTPDIFLQDSIERHYQIIISLICNRNNETKIFCISNFSKLRSFINILNADQKDNIYTKLKLFVDSCDKDLKYKSLAAICDIATCFPGREEDITRIIIKNVNPQQLETNFQDIQYSAIDCFDNIGDRIVNESLSTEILRFREFVE